jgi:hypothetical protein
MKTRILLTAIILAASLGWASGQEENSDDIQTLFKPSGNKVSHGGYGAFTVGYTNIGEEDALLLGGRAGWLIDHHITIGLAGYGFANSIYVDKYFNESGYYLVGGYGGFFIEPIIAPKFPVHVAFPILIGGGGVAYNEYRWADYPWDYEYYYEPYDVDAFFVFEPGVEIELNLIKFLRVAFGASYRITDKVTLANSPDDMLQNFNANVTFKFGKF